ncbi:hypothetical protein IWX91DRAFT_56040 [Phyllosticta citricarpa]
MQKVLVIMGGLLWIHWEFFFAPLCLTLPCSLCFPLLFVAIFSSFKIQASFAMSCFYSSEILASSLVACSCSSESFSSFSTTSPFKISTFSFSLLSALGNPKDQH